METKKMSKTEKEIATREALQNQIDNFKLRKINTESQLVGLEFDKKNVMGAIKIKIKQAKSEIERIEQNIQALIKQIGDLKMAEEDTKEETEESEAESSEEKSEEDADDSEESDDEE